LLFKFYLNNQIRKKKFNRIKKILTKIYLPFYGNLNEKQLTALLKKNKKKKSKFLNKNETILSSLENRLDVVVYRLNLAPNIL
jgi:ribosomal protein S4